MKKKIFELRDRVKSRRLTLKDAHKEFLVLYNVSKRSEPLITEGICYTITDGVIISNEDNVICRKIINGC